MIEIQEFPHKCEAGIDSPDEVLSAKTYNESTFHCLRLATLIDPPHNVTVGRTQALAA